jgi:hypothetical protein
MKIEQAVPYPPPPERHEQRRDLIVYNAPPMPTTVAGGPGQALKLDKATGPIGKISADTDPRNISPRHIANLSMDLYVEGVLSWEEHMSLSFQAELEPAFNRTVGALIGRKAQPDRPRDFIAIWEKRLAFDMRHNGKNRALLEQTRRISHTLHQIEKPTDLVA